MAVVMASSTRSADDLIRYALEPKKDQRGERYVMASGTGGLLVSLAQIQMRDVRERWGKNRPGAHVQAYHVIQSFSATDELDPADPSDWMTAQYLGVALAEEVFEGRQVLVVTQRDGAGGCLHNHLVASSVNTTTGGSLNSSVVMHARLVETHEAVLEREGFEQRDDLKEAYTDALDRRDRGEPSRLRRAATKEQRALLEATRHAQWQAERAIAKPSTARRLEPFSLLVMKQRIDRALTAQTTTDWTAFVTNARAEGVVADRSDEGSERVSFGMMRRAPDGSLRSPTNSDRRRGSTLGADYTSPALERRIANNVDSMARSARAMSSLLTAEDEREVEARLAVYWAKLENDRAARLYARSAPDMQPEEEPRSTSIADGNLIDPLADTPTSDSQEERVWKSPGTGAGHTSPLGPPAPGSAGADNAPEELSRGIEISEDFEAAQPAPTPARTEVMEARSILEARRRRLRQQALVDLESQDDPLPDGGLELDL